ncbi:MAG: hypothetical protein A2Y95_00670 [Deltaproteobacteria bacterium RBG_13_65_10]|nr:MAG: hypothetical protein A2Y95_00670 [Deltaproteobacteria bacterium RBG_13_65_10]
MRAVIRKGPGAVGTMRRALAAAASLAIALVALWVRFAPAPSILTPSGVILTESDPFYHARRILLALAHFPRVPQFDAYMNFPEGARIYWPSGFDLAMATLAGLGGGSHDPERAMRICAEAVPFMALLSIAATGLLAREIGGRLAGLGAAALLAFTPYQVEYTVVGRVDHHVLEPFFLAAVLVAFLRAAQARSPRVRDGWALGCGALLALAFWFVTTAILIPAFLAAGILLARALEALGRAERRGLGRPAAVAFFSAAVFLVPLVLESSFGRAGEFSYLGLSWLQETVVLAAGLAVIGADWILPAGPGRGDPGHSRKALAAAGAVLAGLGAWVLWGLASGALLGAGAFLFRPDPILATVLEAQSPLRAPLWALVRNMTPWILWTPMLWIGLLASAWRRRFANLGEILILAAFPLSLAFFFLQFRFGVLLGVPLCALTGWGLSQAVVAVRERRGLLLAAGTALATVATPIVVVPPLSRDALSHFRGLPDSAVVAFRWIRIHTPPTRGYDDPVVRPEYGILCAWEDGHALTYLAHRPNVANPFGLAPWHIRGALRASEIFLDQNPDRAAARCDALSIRYVVTESTRGEIISLAVAGYGKQNKFAREIPEADGSMMQQVYPPYFETLHARLAVFDGAAIPAGRGVLPALEGFRLVYESPEEGELSVNQRNGAPIVPRHTKVFERVRGARLEGSCAPKEIVLAAVEVETNAGRRFVFENGAICDGGGRFSIRVPYAPASPGGTGTLAPYEVTVAGRRLRAEVTEKDVTQGRAIRLTDESS